MRRTVGSFGALLLGLTVTNAALAQQQPAAASAPGAPGPAAPAPSASVNASGELSPAVVNQQGQVEAGAPAPVPAQPYPPPGYPPPAQVQPYPQPYPPQPGYPPPYPQQPYPPPQQQPGWPQAQPAPAWPPQQPVEPSLAPPPVQAEPPPAPVGAGSAADTRHWSDKLTLSAFIDGYAGFNFMTPRPQTGRNRFRAFDTSNGFSLAWVGVNGRYGTDEVSGTLDLRFGPAATALAKADAANGLSNIKQAFATWRPGGKEGVLTLDFGKFDSIYGVESPESQNNFNYTRGLVFWLAQPMFHTGLRASVDINPNFWITGLVANGWNNSLDNNLGKSFGLQVSAAVPRGSDPASLFDVHLGYLMGPEQVDYGSVLYCTEPGEVYNPNTLACDANYSGSSAFVQRDAGGANGFSAFRHLIDLAASLNPSEKLSLRLNADLGFEGVRQGSANQEGILAAFDNQSWWGVAASGRYAFSPVWAGALRAEVLGDGGGRVTAGDDLYVNGVKDLFLYSATLTIEAAPTQNLLVRLDGRLDGANEKVFPRLLRSYEQVQPTVTLGVVAKTD